MKIKIFYSWFHKSVEKKANLFLEENKGQIKVIEIKWRFFFEHYVMIIYEEKFQ